MPKQQPKKYPQTDVPQPAKRKSTVFFDGGCALCRREIAYYRRLPGADGLHWIDIMQSHAVTATYGLDRETAMARFHVLDASGQWQTGAWGFAELWSKLPGYRRLASTLRALHLLPLLDRVYTLFARWRFRHRCSDGACDISGF